MFTDLKANPQLVFILLLIVWLVYFAMFSGSILRNLIYDRMATKFQQQAADYFPELSFRSFAGSAPLNWDERIWYRLPEFRIFWLKLQLFDWEPHLFQYYEFADTAELYTDSNLSSLRFPLLDYEFTSRELFTYSADIFAEPKDY